MAEPNLGSQTPADSSASGYGGTIGTTYTPEQAASLAANIANEESSLAALVSRNHAEDILGGGKAGAPIFIRQPTTLVAKSRAIDDITNDIVMDQISEKGVTLNLSRQMDYEAVALDEADMNLNLKDFGAQVLKPVTKSVVDLLEDRVRAALRSVDSIGDADGADDIPGNADDAPGPLSGLTYDPAKPVALFTRLRKYLRDNGVPVAGIRVLVGTGVYADLLDADAITDVSQSGSTAALREAAIGKVRGMLVVERSDLDDFEVIAFHRDAVVLATRAPAVPVGQWGQTVSEAGFSLRYLRDYVTEKTAHRAFVSTFSAVGIMPTWRVVRNRGTLVDVDKRTNGGTLVSGGESHGRSVTLEQIPDGGIVRIPDLEALPTA